MDLLHTNLLRVISGQVPNAYSIPMGDNCVPELENDEWAWEYDAHSSPKSDDEWAGAYGAFIS